MNPIPCAHCGANFMRQTLDPESPKLCNNCSIREENRNHKKGNEMENQIIDILIKCPKEKYAEIEEICISNGHDVTKYFMNLHANNGPKVKEEMIFDNRSLKEKHEKEDLEEVNTKNKGKKK